MEDFQMRVNDMARMENFDINKLLGTENSKSSKKAPTREDFDYVFGADMYTPSSTFFVQPNWNTITSKSDPLMSDEEFEKAIWEMAWQDAANGLARMSNPEVSKLRGAYVSVVSPDRQAAYAQTMAQTGGKMPINNVILDGNGNRLMNYNPGGFWLPRTNDAERSRLGDFNRMYLEAYAAYEKEHGKVEIPQSGPATVTRITNPFKYING